VKLSQFLSEFYGIKTRADLYAWLRKNAKPNQSNYQIMVGAWGERNVSATRLWETSHDGKRSQVLPLREVRRSALHSRKRIAAVGVLPNGSG